MAEQSYDPTADRSVPPNAFSVEAARGARKHVRTAQNAMDRLLKLALITGNANLQGSVDAIVEELEELDVALGGMDGE